jgi:hypothetical protein
VVLHAITAPRILATCRSLARNLPFVDHVALMGLESTGFAIANHELLWTTRWITGTNLPKRLMCWPGAYQSIICRVAFWLGRSGRMRCNLFRIGKDSSN